MPRPLLLVLSVGLLLASFLALPVRGQQPPKPTPGDVMIEKYLAAETDRLSQHVLDGAKTLPEWRQRRERLRQEFLDMLGLWPLPQKTPLKATVTGSVEHTGVVIDKLHFQSVPGLYVTANLYRPKTIKGKLPAIVYVCGHSWKGRDGNKSAFQDHGLWFASNGYVCIILDTLQLGEIPGVHHGTYGRPNLHLKGYGIKGWDVLENRFWWQAAGYTPAGVECWNGIRVIDYLLTRSDVDPQRIGVTGISGGGATTCWIAAADERVKAAVPVSGMSDLESYVKNKVINGHCDCMFAINHYGWEWTTILALVAPRPLLFANSDNDRIFPMDGNRRIIARLRNLYKLHGKPELVDEYVSVGDHNYRPDLRVAVFRFLNKHLKNDTGPVKDADFKPLPGRELRVFPEDRDIPADALNLKIDQTFVPRAAVQLPAKGDFAAWKKGLLRQLRERSFRAFPQEIPAAVQKDSPNKLLRFTTEANIEVEALVAQKWQKGDKGGTLIVLNPGETLNGIPAWAEAHVRQDRTAIVLAPRGVGATAWTKQSPPNYVERAHALLGRTVDQGRVYDVAAVLRALAARNGEKAAGQWRVVGRGQAGVIGAYAALFVPEVDGVVAVEPPASHKDGPIFLGVLRTLDVPQALGLLAPTPLTLVGGDGQAFAATRQIYAVAGAEQALQRK